MTLSRRGFLGGLAGLLSLLVWPWKAEPTPPEEMQGMWWPSWNESDDLFLYGKTQIREDDKFFQGRLIINENPLGESPSVQALEDTDMLAKMLEAREKLDPQPFLTLDELERRIEDDAFSIDMLAEPTHFQGITKRYS